ncbi:MAG: bifunctional 3-(3-hydroxy-phenyl)propionate/3-hydroxycinnamic acid hydroxylase, partial [Nocardioides sp.]|uniref:bifunctional 3-(3-hydroxy-phenyl)propionate/3-hydroxycinnamic acid hydroxylase n=1 Tax=Nocardioides sp. TaxID=35761 RepID=UPI003EFC5BB4
MGALARANDYDVAIIGYGPVGVTAANLLGARGLSVLVAERDADVYTRARAISTDEEVLRVWQRTGLADRLVEDMLVGRRIDFVDERRRSFLDLVPQTRGNGHPVQAFIYQPALETELRRGVERYPGVEVRLATEVVRHAQDAAGVELELRDTVADSFSRSRASYVIAADGGSSTTRSQLGVGFEGRTYEDKWVVIDTKVLTEWPEVDRLRFHCNPERPAVDCPTPLGHHRWEFPVLPEDDERALVTEPAVRRLLEGQGITAEHVEVLRAVVYSHHVRFAARWRTGRVFLAGDAAHVMPPWIGQGMASGVRDVNNLCWKLDAVIRGELPDSVLDTYEAERMPHVRRLTTAAVSVGRIITERRQAVTRVRDPLLRAVMRTPRLGQFVRAARWLPMTSYSTGLLAPRGRRDRIVGRMLVQPYVLGPDGVRRKLDDLLAPGWAVLHLSDVAGLDAWRGAGVPCFEVAPPGAVPSADAIVDVDAVLSAWMHARRVRSLAV